jgi:1-acyl-sn-glycerol-3-phosphate acyltransferase
MKYLKWIVVFVATIVICLFFCLILLPLFYCKWIKKSVFIYLTVLWSRAYLFFTGFIYSIKFEVQNKQCMSDNENFILACKHSSMWETIFLYQYFNGATFVLKKELLEIPVFGKVLKKLGMIAIDRKNGINALNLIKSSVNNNHSIKFPLVIFPQGTRVNQLSKDYSLQKYPYKKGIVIVSKQTNLCVNTAAHNAFCHWGKGVFSLKKPGKIILRFETFNKIVKDENDLKSIEIIIENSTNNILQNLQK